uniref:Spectrin repeat containing nuclear envelope protein 2 n=1 Tax=Aotus nancymaae TaxID=37293 RepID=A0A2K5EX71_AOTNA
MASSPELPTEDEQVSWGIDDLHISLQAEQEDIQKKTFTCWINSQLARHISPSVISDLFTDIKKGHVLLDLLEVLSGQQLPRDKGSNTFQCRINIEHALTFLRNRSVSLILTGNFGPIIEKLAQTLSCNYNQPSLDDVSVVDSSPTSSPPAKKCSKVQARWQVSAKKALLLWAQQQCATYESVNVTDFKSSWRNGMAFLAVIHALRPDLIDMKSVKHRSNKDNLREAFRIAEQELKIPRLLEPEDVDVVDPDEKSIMTYVAQFLQYSKDAHGTGEEAQGKVKNAMVWLTLQKEKLQKLLKDSENDTYFQKYNSLLSFMESFNEEKRSFLDVLLIKRNLDELDKDQLQLGEAWDGLNHQINAWTVKLNCALPPPLHQTEAWLQEVEGLMDEDLSTSQDYSQDMTLIQEKMTLFKSLMDRFEYHSNNLLTFENRDENHLPLVPPDKLEEMKRRINNILEKKFILLLEFHYYKSLVLGLLDEVKSKLDIWNIKYGSRESVELLLEDWHKFIEEKGFLAQLDTSFQKCEEIYKNLAGECQNISKQYMVMKSDVCMYRKNIYNVKSTLQKVLAYWATYVENLRLIRACFEEIKKEEIKEVPFETLAQWNLEHGTLNEAGNFLIEVSNDVVGSSISKELRRLNKRWRKFVSKTQLEMNLPLIKKQDQPTFDNSGNIQLSKEEKATVEFSTDLSIEPPENCNQNIKAGEEHEKENEESTGQLKVAKDVEKVIGQVEIWEAETKSVLDLLRDQDVVNTSVEESLKHLIAKGSMYEELMVRTEDMLHMDIQNISSQESFQHDLTTGLQAKIQAAKEKVQINVVKLIAALKSSTDVSPELDVRLKMEESQKELESYMMRAQQLLGQRESPGGLISKYKEALIICNTKSLAKYLKAVEELKNNVTEDIKMSLEEKRRDICATWESLHHELSLYVQQLKIDIEKGKLSDNISKLEKQINKEKKLIRRGRTKGLIKEHEACFSEEGCLYQLNHHMEVLRELCEELPSQKSQQEVKRLLKDYEQKIERLLKCASEIHTTLQATAGGTSRSEGTITTSENRGGDSHSEVLFAKSDNQPSAEKAMEPVMNFSLASELKPPQEESIMEKDHSASINSLLERYDTYRDNLEHHLQNNEFRVTSDFSSEEDRSSSCLQAKLTDLQVLKNETDACWKEFEIISLKLENLANDIKKPFIVKERDRLKERERELQMTLNTRMQSLETALQLVLPVEKASLLLCGSDLLLHKMAIQEFGLINADGIYQHLRNIQDSIAKQIEICNRLKKPGNFVLKELHPCDLHAMQNIILKYKTQFEEMNCRLQRSEDTLRALEGFLESLKTAKLSAEPVIDLSASDTQVAQENTLTVKNTEGDIHLMKDKAKHLDKRLKMLDMSFKDAEQGEDTSCENLVDALSVKLSETHGYGVQEEFTEENTLLEACIFKNNELLKNIQDVQSQISKIGLKDPTVPAVKHRKKSLIRLDKDLDEYEAEKKHLQEMANSLPHCKDGREKAVSQQCQNTILLWENTKAFITECLEQCGRVLELLKQYQNFKGILTTLIQKEESVISLQASYMGKENLKKRIAEIEIVKEEFNEHLEVVDKINQICKNLQFHLNKMKTFEEPPFEKESNIIVDRWLDINEKTEDYYESLGRALALWDKLFNLKNVIDEWTENALQKMELHQLTEEDRERLKEELQVHQQKASEFSQRVAEIQFLLQSSEIPLELQVMESSILSKIEHVQKCLTGESNNYALSGSTAELREDLDQAKTQIGMTESLLKALSPSDSLEIFTKLEEIQQQILQQKHSMILLENQIGCLTPELSELKKQYESVSDLFNTKKSVLRDHFSKLLNDQCKNFNDWFSNIKMNLKECFESSETKRSVEQKLQKLSDFLTLEGRNSKIQQVDSVLKHVKKHLPKAHVKELSSWLVGQEFELEKMESICQARAKELEDYLEHLLRLQDEHRNLSKWLTNQEEKWKGMEEPGEKTELFCHALARKREQFESVAQLNSSLKEYGFTEEEEIIMQSTCLMDRYQTLLRQLSEIEEEDKLPPTEDQSFNDLAHDVIHWIKEIKESLMVLNSSEGKMPLQERIQKIKEIILLKPEGDARIETIMKQAESSEAPLVQKTLTDISNQWDNTLHLASTYLSHQEKLLLEGEKYLQSKEDLRLMLTELKKKQEAGFALQHGLQEKKAQLKIYKKFLKKAQDLTSLLKELKSQGNYLLECTKNPSFSEEPWLEIKHLHESLLQQLQDSVQNLEGHVREHDSYQVCVTDLNTTLDNFSKEFITFSDKPVDQIAVEEKLQKLQELENRLSLQDGTLKKILALAKSVKQNTSSVGQKIIKDDIKSLKYKQKDLENRLESAKQEMEYCLNSILKSKCSSEKKEKFTLPGREKQATSDVRESTQGSAAMEKLEEDWEINKDSAVETVMSKQLSLNVQETMKNTEDEQKVNELQNQPLELDIMLRNEQLEEIKFYLYSFSRGPLDSVTYLDKIKKFIASIEKEKDSLGNLKIKWENLSNHVTDMDKKLLESQIKQLEHGWEQVEQQIQKKYSQQVVEYGEFTSLMNKIRDTEISLQQQQQHLQLRLKSPEEQAGNQSMIALTTDLQAAKHGFSILKGQAEFQMKRIWGEKEKKILEDGINNLKKQWETLEPLNLEAENQIKKCDIRNKMKETILWAKNLLGELIPSISLLPDDILSQIRKCKVTHDGILDRQQAVESLAEEVKDKVPSLTTCEGSDLNNTLEDLRNQYQMLVLKSTQRSQQLEFKLEERSNFFAIIRKFQLMAQESETLITPKVETTATEAELKHHHVTLKASQKELQEIDNVISIYLQELTNIYEELNVFERLFLDDQLKNLKNRTNRTQRFIQNKCNEVEHKINFCREFHEKTLVLQEEVDSIQRNELLLNQEVNTGVKEAICNLKDRLTAIRCSILQVLKLKKVFDFIGLNWDFSQLDQLQTQVFEKEKELEEKIKQLDTFEEEHGKYQALLSEMRAIDLQIKKMTEVVLNALDSSPESRLLNAQILSQRIEKAKCLCEEIIKKLNDNKTFDDSFKEKEILQIKLNAEENDKLYRVLQNMVLDLPPKEMAEKNFQDKLETSFHVLNQIKSQLQQPLLINLEIKHIQNEKDNCKGFQEQVWAEVCSIRAVTAIEKQRERKSSRTMERITSSKKLGMISQPEAKLQLQCTLQELVSKNSAMKEAVKVQETEAKKVRYLENYKCCRKIEEDIYTNLSKIETVLGQSMSSLPLSYREALEHLEKSKALVSNLISTKEELMKLRQILRLLRLRCTENDGICLLKIVSALWEKWLSLLEAAKEWEMWCEELKQEWKFVSEEIEREAIILDNLQEELPEISKTKEAATTEELSELLDCLCQYGENVEKQQLLLTLLLQRIRSIQNVPEGSGAVETVSAFQEITSMQERCNQLLQKAQKNKALVQTEIQERHSFTKEIIALKNLFQHTTTSFQNMAFQDHPEKAEQLEELQSILKKGKLTFENIMEKLRIKYSEMYTIVPAEIESQVEECRKALEDIDEKVIIMFVLLLLFMEPNDYFPSSQQRRKNVLKQTLRTECFTFEIFLCPAKFRFESNLLSLSSSKRHPTKFGTASLSQATVKMEEYSDLLKSTEAWIENTSRLLANPADYDSSKTLSHHASTLQVSVLRFSNDRHNLLHSILMDLEDLSIISIQELSDQVTIQQMADVSWHHKDDVVAIEFEVKSMEKRVSKIKTILLSKEILDFSPEEHLKHGEVILENICPMKKTIAEIVSYQVGLRLPQTGMKPLPVFQRTNQLLQDIKLLENVTQEQNELLKVVIKQTNECDEEIENLKQILNNHSAQFSFEHMSPDQAAKLPQLQEEIEDMEKQILSLNQKKEDLLVDLKATVLNLHQHLKQEQEKVERDVLPAVASEEGRVAERDASEWKLNRRGSMSYLAAVEEEAEESSVKSENGDEKAEPPPQSWSSFWKHDKDVEEGRASSSSGTIVQEAYGKISTCDNSMAQILAPDSPNTEQGSECSLRTNQTEEGTTPPIKVATLDSSDTQGGLEHRVEKTRPEPAEVLHACKTQVAELELWLQQANVAFEPETLNADMQQVVEQQLVGCQAMLTEIEHKVAFLLEACKDQGLGDNGATQYEAEALSLKLRTVKCNLEKVQMMLQEKHSEDQHPTILKNRSEPEHQKVHQPVNLSELESTVTERPQFSRQKDFQQQQVLELKPMEQKDFIKFIEFNAKKMWPQYCQHDKATTQESSASNQASSPENDVPHLILSPQGQNGDKWQYLHHELSSKIKLPLPQLVEPQVSTNMSILPSVSMYNFRYPTTEELKTYTTQLEDLRQEASNLQTQENMTEETYVNLEKKLFELFLTLSQCLSSVEEMLQMAGLYREDGSAQQVHYETLALELKKLYLALSDKKGDLLKAMTWPGRNTNLLLECFDNLQVCLEHTQAAAASRSKSLKAGLDYNRSFQNEIKRLYDHLIKSKMSLQQSLNEISGQSVAEQLQKADAHTVELENSESRVAKLRDEGERLHLPYVLLQEVYKLEDVLDSMWGILRARGPFVTESQQDALLQGVVELVKIGKEKLAHDPFKQTKSKVALQAQIENHKVFFQKLVADMLLIQAYSAKILPSLLQKRETFWAEQVTEVKILEEKSRQRGMKLQSLLQKWEEFDENYASLEKDLEILLSTLPSVSLVEETEERLVERISFYQQIKRNIGGKHARLYQTLNEGKQLVVSVSCPELEGQIAKLEEQWLSLNKKIDHELHRLQTLVKHLLSYNRDSDQLTKWLESSQHTLNYWKEQSLNVSQDLDTIRSNINNFFEFSKEVDEKSSLKTAVISTGNQLLHLKETDTATLRASLAQFEQKWTMLITQLPDIQEKLHQLQMEKLPSRKAITEMISWMNNVEHQTSDEDSMHSPSSASQVKHLLQKHKEFRMEMDYKQWIVDFVNQSLLQLSTCDVESKRYERTEFAEHLGEMNRQWHRVHGMLNRKIQHLEQLLESITESENKIQILNNWMEAQEERLKTLQKPESVISVQKLLLDCQDIENQVAIKSKALDELKQSYLTLESGGMPVLEDTASRIDGLFQKRSSVITQVNQLKISMQSVLQEWKIYDQLYDEVNMMTIRFWYCMEHSKPVVLSLEALRCQVENLQSLQDEAESSEGSWEKLQEVIGKLKGLCPSVAEIIEEKCQDTHKRWTQVNQAIADQLQKAQSLLQLWKAYSSAHAEAAARLKQQEAKFQQLANISMSGNNLAEILPPALQDIKELQHDVQKTKEDFLQNSTVLDRLPQPAESSTHMLLLGPLYSLQRAAYLEKILLVKANEFEDFGDRLESLKGLLMHEEENLDRLHQQEKENPDSFLNHVLALTAQSPDIEHLNEVSLKLPLSDIAVKTLQNMNRQWIRATATALERCSKLQGIGLNEKFLYCCEKWTQLLEKIEEALKVDVANSLPELLEQQKTYEMLEAEVSINQTIADSFVTQSLQLLDTTEIENRPEFISEFSKLTDRWQNAVQGVRQRKSDIDGLVRQWQDFTTSVEDLLRFLTDTSHLLSAVKGQEHFSLYQTRSLIHELKNKKIHFQRWRTTYALTLEAGEKLLLTTDLETKESMGRRISQLQDNWNDTEPPLAEMIQQFQSTVETWDQCEKKIKELKSRLRVLKAQSEDPLPELHEDLHNEKELIKELEKSLASWTQNLKELQTMKADLTRHVPVEDVMVLKEQIEHLHRQWEDLCFRVAIRKQEIEDRLNSWIVFNEKNKELCAWLVQMENKVLQTADISIEEMIEKLQKDCMEEINLFSENKLQLKQMGDQLIKASNQSRAAEIDDKLNKVNDRWQHLFDVIGSRVKKLKETFAFIQQLDKNMSNLRTWLARIESELSKPVVYDVCDDQEIQKRLAEQQDLQRDIEQHSAGVESVFNICDVLLHDSDACANETECDSIQQTTRSLDRRWRNICAMSMERRMKIEETWRLWQKFLDDYSRFEDWLKSAERTAACPNSSEVLYTSAKEELKRFEAFQRQIHERLTQLELINKQYRRLARENRTDTASRLKQMVHEGNQRWDNLQRRVTAVLRRLRHFTNQREEFEGTRESILVWLTEMDLQLTNVEHFSESDADDKMRQLNGFQQEITLNTNKIDQLIVFGEQLIQKSEPLDAVLIEDELEELHRYCQEVFGRVSRFHRRLTSHAPGLEDEKEASENETDMEDPREIQTDSWRKRGESEEPSSPQSLCHLVSPAPGHERSGCETPVSVDSIPLEWDHTGDVGGSSSHEEDEEGPYYSALSGKSISDGHSWHVPDSPSCPKHHYKQTEGDGNVPPVPAESSTPYNPPYVSLDSTGNIAFVCNSAFDRWELIQAQELHNKLKIKQNLQQLNSDISAITTWLKKTKAELEMLKTAKPPSDIQEIELRVKRLKEILKAFDTYKALVVSVNMSSKEFLQTESAESTELQSRLHQLSLLWEATQGMVDSCRGGLRQSLMQCQDFHHLSQNLLLWLANAENRRQKAHVAHPKADPQALLECQRELMQLEKELVECQPQVDLLQEISDSLLIKGHGEEYIEAEEKVHVIEKKLEQLREQVSQDLMSLQGTQNPDSPLPGFDEVDSGDQPLSASMPAPRAKQFRGKRTTEGEEETESRVTGSTRPQRSFLSRVIRAALPLQLLLLLLLLLACLLPSSEEDYSCTQANNFARSFYPMLRYTNGPPPT